MQNLTFSKIASLTQAKLINDDLELTNISTDTRTIKSGNIFLALTGENFDGHNYIEQAISLGATGLVISDETKLTLCGDLPVLVFEDTLLALGQIAKLHRMQFDIPVIAITGSCGKTTTKEMIKAILSKSGNVLANEANYNNEIGVPKTLLNLNQNHDFAVIEMGARRVGDINYLAKMCMPSIAMVTNVAPVHIEIFGSIDNIASTKGEIYSALTSSGVSVVNVDDVYAPFWISRLISEKVVSFSLERQADVMCSYLIEKEDMTKVSIISPLGEIEIDLPIAGLHNVANLLSAVAAVTPLNVNIQDIKEAIESMNAIPSRTEIKPGENGSVVIDDCYNANPVAMLSAINVLMRQPQEKKVLVVGDMLELGPLAKDMHEQIGRTAKDLGVNQLFAVGDNSKSIVEKFGEGAKHYADNDSLTTDLKKFLDKDTAVLVKASNSMKLNTVVDKIVN